MLMLLLTAAATTAGMPRERQKHVKHTDMETLQLTAEWDKTFPQSDKVLHTKITFHNRYGITLAADSTNPGERPAAWPPSLSAAPTAP